MAVFNEPTQWSKTLVNSGDANAIPDTTPAGSGDFSFEDGFPTITQVPLGAGGIAPDRKDFNGAYKILGDWVFYGQNGGMPSYNNTFDYVVGRVVLYNGNIYKCIQTNGASSTVVAPDSVSPLGSDYWKDIENQDSTSLIPNQIIQSPVPLTDANLHLLDGALLSGSGAYSEYVDLIAELYNGGTASSSFCTEAEWQTSNTNYGFCNKFVYDSVNNTVRLPKVNSEHGALIKSYQSGTSWYRIYEDGWCEQGGVAFAPQDSYIDVTLSIAYLNTDFATQGVLRASFNVSSDAGLAVYPLDSSSIKIITGVASGGSDVSWECSGYVDITDLQIAPIYEYIVVGTVSKTDIQIDIDNVMTDLALKADKDLSNATPTSAFATAMNSANIRTVVETYVNGTSWYRVYSDGWCEQGGFVTSGTAGITFLKPYRDTNYSAYYAKFLAAGDAGVDFITGHTTTGLTFVHSWASGNSNTVGGWWLTCGYIS